MKSIWKYICIFLLMVALITGIIYLVIKCVDTTRENISIKRKTITELRKLLNNKQYTYKKAEPWEKETTILVKTFLRPKCILRLIHSIRKYYSHVPIVVVDDSKHKLIHAGHNNLNIFSVHMPYYQGVSRGKNEGLKYIKTKYTILLDDDMVFTVKSKMGLLYNYLENNTNTALLGTQLSDRGPYRALFEKTPTEIKIKDGEYLYQNGPVTYSHRALNCFMCRTELLVNVPWDNNLKTNEHTEHFYRIYKNGYSVGDHSEVEVDHSNDCGDNTFGYKFFREISSYEYYIVSKHNVDKFGDMIIDNKQKKFAKTLNNIANSLNKLGVKFALSSGTALGVHREMQFIDHDYDIDLVVMRKDITNDRDLMNVDGFELSKIYGTLENGLEYNYRDKETDVSVDIFIMYEEKYYNWWGCWNVEGMGDKVTKWKFTKDEMESIYFLNRTFNIVPMNHIRIEYGDTWMIPKKLTYHEGTSKNHGFVCNDDDLYPDDGPVPIASDNFVNEFFRGNIWFINLDRHEERLLNVHKQMDRIGIKIKRFPAINGEDNPQVSEIMLRNSTKISKGEVACTMSHREIWKHAFKNKIPWTLIFEDDIHILESISQYEFGEGMAEALAGRRNPQMVYFGACSKANDELEQYNKFNSIKVSDTCPCCTHAYAFTWKIAQELLRNTEVYDHPVDMIIKDNKVCKPGLISLVDTKEMSDDNRGFGNGIVLQNRDEYPSVLR